MELAVPVSTISGLSAGEFVGMVADSPDEIIELKTFHAMVVNDHETLKRERESFLPLPVFSKVDQKEVYNTYQLIKRDIQDIVESVMEEILNDPGKQHLVVKGNQ